MNITLVEINDKELFEGAKVRNRMSGQVRTIKSLPINKTVWESIKDGSFNADTDIDYSTVMLNKSRFELVD